MARTRRFTVYDVLDERGYFDLNPANPGAQDSEGVSLYSGPVEFPKMLFHPEGKERVTSPGEVVASPGGKEKLVGEQKELIWELARSEEEEKRLLALGWHRHPSHALRAAGKDAPLVTVQEVLGDKDKEIERLRARLAALETPIQNKPLGGLQSVRSAPLAPSAPPVSPPPAG